MYLHIHNFTHVQKKNLAILKRHKTTTKKILYSIVVISKKKLLIYTELFFILSFSYKETKKFIIKLNLPR